MNQFHLPEKVIRFAGFLATLIGTFKVIGTLSGIWIFSYLANTLAISPAPSPYERLSNVDPNDVNAGRAFACVDSHGNNSWYRWNHVVRGAIPGPHRRNVTFLSYFNSIDGFIAKGADER